MKRSVKLILFFILIICISSIMSTSFYKEISGISTKYSDKSIKIIVAYDSKDSTYKAAKVLAENLKQKSGMEAEVVGLDGLEGQLGYKAICNANPNGYTIGIVDLPTLLCFTTPSNKNYSKDTIIPLVSFTYDKEVLIVKNNDKFNTLNDFIDYSESHPKDINFSNSSYGDISHVLAAYLAYMARIEVTHVPFNGSDHMIDAVKNQYVDACVAELSEVKDSVNNGEVKILASFTKTRLKDFPDVPTLYEYNYPIDFSSVKTVVIPNKTPGDIVEKIHYSIKETVESNEFCSDCSKLNINVNYMGPDETYLFMDKEQKLLKSILHTIDFK